MSFRDHGRILIYLSWNKIKREIEKEGIKDDVGDASLFWPSHIHGFYRLMPEQVMTDKRQSSH